MEYFGYVYKFTNKITGKIYVGKREKPTFDKHYWGSGTYWTNSLNKHGKENILREVLEWCDSRDSLNEAEKKWIAELDATNRDVGYNIASGGGGVSLTGDSLRLRNDHISESHKQRYQDGTPGIRTGMVNSEEHNERIREAHLKRCTTEYICLETGDIITNKYELGEFLNCGVKVTTGVRKCAEGERCTAFGYHWAYNSAKLDSNESRMYLINKIEDERHKKASEVSRGKKNRAGTSHWDTCYLCVELNGVVNSIHSLRELTGKQNVSREGIRKCVDVNNNRKTAYGYHWKIIDNIPEEERI